MSSTIPVPIDALFELAEREGIRVEWYPDPMCPRGRYIIVRGTPVILLSPRIREDPMRLRCTLAHELGHHFTGTVGNWCLHGHEKDDARADRWAQRFLLPDWWLWPRRTQPPGELAEESGVYQIWVEARLKELAAHAMAMQERDLVRQGGRAF